MILEFLGKLVISPLALSVRAACPGLSRIANFRIGLRTGSAYFGLLRTETRDEVVSSVRLCEFLQALYPYLGEGRTEAEFVPHFFTEVMEDDPSGNSNPFLNLTPDYINRVYKGDKNLDRSKATSIKPALRPLRFQALVDRVLPDGTTQAELADLLDDMGADTSGPKLGFDLHAELSKIITNVANGSDAKGASAHTANKRATGRRATISATPAQDIYVADGVLHVGGKSVELPSGTTVSPNIETYELGYITQLCMAFSQQFGRPVTFATVQDDNDCGEEFREHRAHYYNADAIRVMLEKFPDGLDEFGVIKDETLTGVQAAWRLAASGNGYARLQSTLQQAGQLELGKSKIAQTAGVMGQSERAGVCHILVGEERLWWVKP